MILRARRSWKARALAAEADRDQWIIQADLLREQRNTAARQAEHWHRETRELRKQVDNLTSAQWLGGLTSRQGHDL